MRHRSTYFVSEQERGVRLHEGAEVSEVRPGKLVMSDGSDVPFDECLWCTQASAAPWIADTGLKTGEEQHTCKVTYDEVASAA